LYSSTGEKLTALTGAGLGYTATCVALRPGGGMLAVGGEDCKTHIYSIGADFALTLLHVIETRSIVTALAFHPTGELLAIGDVGRQIEVWQAGGEWEARVRGKWVFHTSRITSLSWSPSGQYLASGSLDEAIYIWNLAQVRIFCMIYYYCIIININALLCHSPKTSVTFLLPTVVELLVWLGYQVKIDSLLRLEMTRLL
jgi:WD40 repeat protein